MECGDSRVVQDVRGIYYLTGTIIGGMSCVCNAAIGVSCGTYVDAQQQAKIKKGTVKNA